MLAHIPIRATKDDLRRFAEANEGWRVELQADGELTMAPPTGGSTGQRNSELAVEMRTWARANGYVAFDSSTGFELPSTAVLSPDAAIVRQAEWDALSEEEREDFVPLVPVVAVELVSKSDRPAELRKKLEAFRAAGTSYVVLIDPYRKEIWTDGEAPAGFDLDFRPIRDLK
jgi:Uma2 family endonuclease